MDSGQRRARVGGEFGANGEWYEGGRFVATQEHTVKQAPTRRDITPEDAARRARELEQAVRVSEWLAARRVRVAGIVAQLTANPGDVDAATWNQRVVDHAAGFLPSLGRTLDVTGSLTDRQAQSVTKALLGRRSKRNADEWDGLIALLTEEFA